MISGDQNKRGGLLILVLFLIVPMMAQAGAAAEIISAGAEVISAATPAVITAIQADEAKYEAGLNAETSITTTAINSELQKDLSDSANATAKYDALTALRIQSGKIQTELTALAMTTFYKMWSNQAFYQDQHEARKQEYKHKDDLLALDYKKHEAEMKVKEMQLRGSLVQAGLSTGFKTVVNHLGINRIFGSKDQPSQTEVVVATKPSSTGDSSKAFARLTKPLSTPLSPVRGLSGKEAHSLGKSFANFFSQNPASGSTANFKKRIESDLVSFEKSLAKGQNTLPASRGIPHQSRQTRELATTHGNSTHGGQR